ncbi:MAG: hypothetical protein RIF41_40220 [Polyangiaceae bacterium]
MRARRLLGLVAIAAGWSAACVGAEPTYAPLEGGGGQATGGSSSTGGDGGTVIPKSNGESCSGGDECESGFCPEQDGVCCDVPCDTLCEACVDFKTGAGDGTCAPVTPQQDPDDECVGVDRQCVHPTGECHACDGIGGCRLKDGAECGLNEMCISNFCNLSAFPWQCQQP